MIDEPDDELAVRDLAAWLRREEIDLVHAHMFRAEVLGTRAAVAAATPVIVATVHSSRVRSAEDIERLAALTPSMDRLIVPSESIRHKVEAEGRAGARFAVIPNGIDLSRFASPAPPCALRRELGIPPDAPLIGVVARLEPEKGHRFLVEAMPSVLRAVPDARLAIVGEGSQAVALADLTESLGLGDRVVLTGRREDVSAVTADLTVAVLPSLREAQGISILEAMARRVPVVASAVGGIPEVITSGTDGLLVPPGDPSALADAIVTLLRDPELRAPHRRGRLPDRCGSVQHRRPGAADAGHLRRGAGAGRRHARRFGRSGRTTRAQRPRGAAGLGQRRSPMRRMAMISA